MTPLPSSKGTSEHTPRATAAAVVAVLHESGQFEVRKEQAAPAPTSVVSVRRHLMTNYSSSTRHPSRMRTWLHVTDGSRFAAASLLIADV